MSGGAQVIERMRRRIESASMPITESGCWIWLGAVFNSGYGDMADGSSIRRAHRASWTVYRGCIPEGALVCHRCDVRLCVNPDHLFLGSTADNMADKVAKRRQARGTAHGRAKITPADVLAIRQSTERNQDLAAHYGLGSTTIQHIRSGKNWGWL